MNWLNKSRISVQGLEKELRAERRLFQCQELPELTDVTLDAGCFGLVRQYRIHNEPVMEYHDGYLSCCPSVAIMEAEHLSLILDSIVGPNLSLYPRFIVARKDGYVWINGISMQPGVSVPIHCKETDVPQNH